MKRRLASDAQTVRAAVRAALPSLLQRWLPGGELRGGDYFALNPLRPDRNLGSFRICMRTGRWRDHAIGVGGSDAISLFAYLFADGDYRTAFKALADDPQVQAGIVCGTGAPIANVANALKFDASKLEQVRSLYAVASPVVAGTAAHTYLLNRGLQQTTAWDRLRTHRLPYPGVGRRPTLIAPVEALDGSLIGLQRTYLTAEGAKLEVSRPKLGLGQVRGGAVRLGDVVDEMIICEGLEDGLTLFQELDIPVWVACGAGFMKALAPPASVRSITIAADNDAAGQSAAYQAADAFNVAGRTVCIMRPAPEFKDFNDQLRGFRHDK